MKQIIPIDQLKVHPENPREIRKADFKKLKASIQRMPEGLRINPIKCNRDHFVLDGNMRLLACKDLGYKEVWVQYVPKTWTENQQKEWMLLANTHAGTFDHDMLANTWPEEMLGRMSLPSWTAPEALPKMERIVITLPDVELANHIRELMGDFLKEVPDATIR
jgi:hypothetical protein